MLAGRTGGQSPASAICTDSPVSQSENKPSRQDVGTTLGQKLRRDDTQKANTLCEKTLDPRGRPGTRCDSTPVRTAETKSGEDTKHGEGAGTPGPSHAPGGSSGQRAAACELLGRFLLNLLTELLEDPAITLLGIYPRKWTFIFTQKFGHECSYQLYS